MYASRSVRHAEGTISTGQVTRQGMEDRLTTTNGTGVAGWTDWTLVCMYSDIEDVPDSDSDLDTEDEEGRDDSSDEDDGVDPNPNAF